MVNKEGIDYMTLNEAIEKLWNLTVNSSDTICSDIEEHGRTLKELLEDLKKDNHAFREIKKCEAMLGKIVSEYYFIIPVSKWDRLLIKELFKKGIVDNMFSNNGIHFNPDVLANVRSVADRIQVRICVIKWVNR